jgi:molybdopterin-guanine dinucleotide biosynthesis protein A
MDVKPQTSRMAFLLAGGKSSRMGENKAFLDFGGRTLLDRGLAELGSVCDDVAIVGDPAIFASYGPVVADVFAGCGPLAGIHSALTHSSADLNLMLAVDMPFVTRQLLRFLFDVASNDDAIVTVPRTVRRLQPLCAVYRRDFAAVAEESLKAGRYKVDAAFVSVPLRVIDESELAGAGFAEKSFFNVNTPQDRRNAEDLTF